MRTIQPPRDIAASAFRVASIIVTAASFLPIRSAQGIGGTAVCRTLSGLTKGQQEVCYSYPQVTVAAIQGLQQAMTECQHQFRWHRWNCSSLAAKNTNPHASHYLRAGYRESGFVAGLAAAGVAQSVARACSQGRLLECGCEPDRHRRRFQSSASFKWGGCSHNLHFGLQFSQLFLDIREKGKDIQSRVNLHNNNAGRLALASNMEVRCKCHGVSGSCELKTCWRTAPDLRVVGAALKDKYRGALMVQEENSGRGGLAVVERRGGNGKRRKRRRRRRRRAPQPESLLYWQKSPDYCEADPTKEVPGTSGRICRRGARGLDSCASLCCGRGYNILRTRTTDKCNCQFHWCCTVTCNNCTRDHWVTVCK